MNVLLEEITTVFTRDSCVKRILAIVVNRELHQNYWREPRRLNAKF